MFGKIEKSAAEKCEKQEKYQMICFYFFLGDEKNT